MTETRTKVVSDNSWRTPSILAFALVAAMSGFGQFGAISALGDVAKAFGHINTGTSLADKVGLSGTTLGVGLAILRAASLGSLFLTGIADRIGRRKVLLGTAMIGLGITACAALSPSYWWFVAIFALGRPFLSATNAVAQVGAAEESTTNSRTKAIALIAAGYGVGAGIAAIIHGASKTLGFRGLFSLALVALLLVVLVRNKITETDQFVAVAQKAEKTLPVFGAIEHAYRRRLFIVCSLAFFVSVVTGPANSFLFVYAQNVLGVSGLSVSLLVVIAAVFGLVGLIIGRVAADRFGRRPTGAVALIAMCLAGVLTYSGSKDALYLGYELAVLVAASFAPAAGALSNELFPTEIRASVAGWNVAAGVIGAVVGLVVFGSISDAGNRFQTGALLTFLPVIAAAALFLLLPETRGHDLEERELDPTK